MSERHEWTDQGRSFLLEADGSLYEVPEVGESPQVGELPLFVALEILRLAEEVERLKGATIYSDSVAAGSVIALGNQTAAKAVAEEGARIRRELEAEIIRETSALGRGPSLGRRKLRSIIDRIVPGEG